jgi:Leucine-rich repeat (LRR) protein
LIRLPDGFKQLSKLTDLHISDHFTEVPLELSTLVSLRRLWLGVNNITVVPAWLGDLTSLEYLSLFGNPVVSLPHELGRLEKLNTLDLRETPLQSPPPNIVKESTRVLTGLGPRPKR